VCKDTCSSLSKTQHIHTYHNSTQRIKHSRTKTLRFKNYNKSSKLGLAEQDPVHPTKSCNTQFGLVALSKPLTVLINTIFLPIYAYKLYIVTQTILLTQPNTQHITTIRLAILC